MQFVKAEEGEVGKNIVESGVVAVGGARMQFEENSGEDLEEFFVTDAAVEDLLDKDLFVGVFELKNGN